MCYHFYADKKLSQVCFSIPENPITFSKPKNQEDETVKANEKWFNLRFEFISDSRDT